MKTALTYIFIFLTLGVTAQSQSFSAKVNKRTVQVGEQIKLTVELTNASWSNYKPPSFDGFRVLSGPSFSNYESTINGRRTSKVSASYSLIAQKEGNFRIGSAQVVVNGRLIKSAPIKISVTPQKKKELGDVEHFLVANLDSNSVFEGQQAILTYQLFTKKSLRQVNIAGDVKIPSFEMTSMKVRLTPKDELINGERWTKYTVARYILYPNDTGQITIDPLILSLDVYKGRSNNSFFRSTERETVISDSLLLYVSPLPNSVKNKSVGRYDISTILPRVIFNSSDAIEMRVEVEGEGNIKKLKEPDLNLHEAFDIVEGEVEQKGPYSKNGKILFSNQYSYSLIPRKSGRITIAPSIKYFDVDSNRVLIKQSNALNIKIIDDTGSLEEFKESEIDKIEDLHINAAGLGLLKKKGRSFFFSPLYFILFLLALLPFGYSHYKSNKDSEWNSLTDEEKKRRKAWKKIEGHFLTLQENIGSYNSSEFYQQASVSFENYLCDKLQLEHSDFSTAQLEAVLEKRNVSGALKAEVMDIFKKGQTSRFGYLDSEEKVSDLYDKFKNLVLQLEENTS